ncbi:MAG: hypothetical protein WCB11_10575 [Terriglobales bacterium]|jgi:hypothetical protein
MSEYSHGRLFAKVLVVSVVLNVLMIAAGLSGGAQGRSTLLTRLSDVVAAPPGMIIKHCCAPRQHTSGAFFLSVLAATGISILFYSLAAWLILELVFAARGRTQPGTSRQQL